jgi:hypothetical protein
MLSIMLASDSFATKEKPGPAYLLLRACQSFGGP